MNTTKASCGHSTWAVGAAGSKARQECESLPCHDCFMKAGASARPVAYVTQTVADAFGLNGYPNVVIIPEAD